eukprot:gene17915-23535_t
MSLSRSEIKLLYADDMTTWNNLLRNKSKDDEISNNSNELNSTSSLLNPTDGIFSHQTFEIANDDSNPSDNFEREVITNSSNNVPSVPEPISNKPDISGNLLSSFSGVRSLQAPGGTSTFSLSNDTSDNLMNYQSYSGVRHIQAPGGDSTIDLSNGSKSNITEVSYSGKRHLQAPGGDSTINLSDSHIVDSKNSNSVIQIAHSTEGMSSIDLSSDNHLIGIDSSQLQKSSFSGIRILQAPGGDSTLDLSKDFILSDNNTTSNFSGVRSLQDPGGTSSLTLSDESTDFINNNTVITFSGVKSLQAPGGTSTLSLSNDTSDDNMNYQSYSGVRQIQAPGGHSTIDLSNKWNTNINNVSYSGVRHLQAPGGNSTINLSSSLSNIDSKEAGEFEDKIHNQTEELLRKHQKVPYNEIRESVMNDLVTKYITSRAFEVTDENDWRVILQPQTGDICNNTTNKIDIEIDVPSNLIPYLISRSSTKNANEFAETLGALRADAMKLNEEYNKIIHYQNLTEEAINKIKDKLNEIMIQRNTNKFHNYSLAKLRWKQATRRIVTQNYVSKVTKHLETLSARAPTSPRRDHIPELLQKKQSIIHHPSVIMESNKKSPNKLNLKLNSLSGSLDENDLFVKSTNKLDEITPKNLPVISPVKGTIEDDLPSYMRSKSFRTDVKKTNESQIDIRRKTLAPANSLNNSGSNTPSSNRRETVNTNSKKKLPLLPPK